MAEGGDCARPLRMEILRNRTFCDSIALANTEESSSETAMPVGADMVVGVQAKTAAQRSHFAVAGETKTVTMTA